MDTQFIVAVVLSLLCGIFIGYLIYWENCKAVVVNAEKFSEYNIQGVTQAPRPTSVADNAKATPDSAASGIGNYEPSDPSGNSMYNPVTTDPSVPLAPAPTCYPRDRLTAEDLLPKDAANSKWSQLNPIGQGDVQDQNFLTAGYHIGVNTQGQSLRNANYQLRSEPSNPQTPIGPWNLTTIQSDTNRRPLEIGGDY